MLRVYFFLSLIFGTLCLSVVPAHAQLDTRHWMPPVWEPRNNGPQGFGGQAGPTELVISTPYTDAEVTVALTNGTPVATGTAVAGTPLIVSLTAFQGMTYAAFTAEGDKGLIITADEPVSVVYRNLSQRNQALASLKGRFALGEEFWAGTQTQVTNEKYGADDVHFISVLATEDGTEVTFDAPTGVNFTTATGLENTITVTLNRNQTYLVRNNNNTSAPTPDAAGFSLYVGDNDLNNLAGTHVTSTQPIAVMSGGQHLRFPQSSIIDLNDPTTPDADAGIDQTVPITSDIFPMIGTEYIIARGGTQRNENVPNDPADPTDYATIIGTAPSTDITIDGTLVTTIGEGDIYEYILPGGRDSIDVSHLIQTSAPAYVYHFSGLSNHELGMSVVPSIDCAGSQYLSFNRFGDADDDNRIHIFAPTTAFDDLTINGQPYDNFEDIAFGGELIDVPVIDWQTFSFAYPGDQPPNVIVQSSEFFHLAVVVGGPLPTPTSVGDPGGTYAFLSNFARKVDVLDPVEGFPTPRYFVDTLMQGDSLTHCLQLASCTDTHTISRLQASPNTGAVFVPTSIGELNDTCLIYVAKSDYLGNDTITVTVSNELGIPGEVELIFTVDNGFAEAVADTFAIDAGEVAMGNVLDNDRNPATGEPPTLVADQTVSNGTLVFNPDGTFTYTPNDGFSGEDQFTYEICDDLLPDSCTRAVVLIQVNPIVNEDNFSVSDTTFTVDRNVALTADLNGSVTAPDGVSYTFTTTPVTPPQNGTATLTDNGTLTYTSTGSFLGTDSLVYEVCTDTDPPVCDQATITFIVTVPDDDPTDSDDDGIPDTDEVGPDPENPQDSDGDGIPDFLDPLELVIYDGFAPGRGDDVWVIDGIRNPSYANNVVKIYNRWGNLVYEVTGYNNTERAWTGEANVSTLGDSTVPDGTYFYVIDLGDGTPPRTGYVVLVR
ncbi:MAG: Ig-like domain-containing protein [Tunicatimonas sp.]